MHFFIVTVLWGVLFAWLDPFLPGQHWFRGAIFATGAWLVMMIVMMPMAGAGLFGVHPGMMAPSQLSFCTKFMERYPAASMEPGRIQSTYSLHMLDRQTSDWWPEALALAGKKVGADASSI